MSEREWSEAWRDEQQHISTLHARGSWLPNVIEMRGWGVVRWTSGRPDHAETSGQAVAETFAVLNPDVNDVSVRTRVAEALRDEPPVTTAGGFDIRQHHVSGALWGAGIGAVLALIASLMAGFAAGVGLLALVLGGIGGAAGGAAVSELVMRRDRTAVLSDDVRVVMGRYAPESWVRLIESVTTMETTLPRQAAEASEAQMQAADAIRVALWEAAGLLIGSSDHTGVEVLADGASRLVDAHRA